MPAYDWMRYRFVRLMILCVGFMFTILAVLNPRHAAAKEDICIPGTYDFTFGSPVNGGVPPIELSLS
jgi:hypothetical protein